MRHVFLRILLIILGFLPLPAGFWLHDAMMTRWFYQMPPNGLLNAIVIIFLLVWFFAGFFAVKFGLGKIESPILFNTANLGVLTLILIQFLFFDGFWTNRAGLYGQFFFLPVVRLARILPLNTIGPYSPFIFSSLMLVLATCLGIWFGGRFRNEQK